MADLLEVTATCIGDLVKQTREVLEDHGHSPGVAVIRFGAADDLLAFRAQDTRPARTTIIETLSTPTLTGMSRDELRALTERLAPRQAAQTERLTHQRRGGLRHPGTRGGIFPPKISNAERVLLTILHLRRLCTSDVLAAALGDVSRSAIGGVIRETRPLLEQHDRAQPRQPPATAPPPTSSPPDGKQTTTRRQVDLLQLHKIRNVRDRLPQRLRSVVEARMRRAYHADSALAAEADLTALAAELDRTHPGAAASLREGMAETLSVLRLGVPPILARTLRSTNVIESMISICRDHSKNTKHWQDGQMAVRWCAAGMGEAGKQFRRVNGHMHVRRCAPNSSVPPPKPSHPTIRMTPPTPPDHIGPPPKSYALWGNLGGVLLRTSEDYRTLAV